MPSTWKRPSSKLPTTCSGVRGSDAEPAARGGQLSVLVHRNGRALFDFLARQGIIADWREPNVIRLAPVPLYNSFADVQRAGATIEKWAAQAE